MAGLYGPSISVRPTIGHIRRWVIVRSPLHYEPGDMRGNYDWQRTILAALLTGWALSAGGRLLVTGTVLALFAPDLSLIVAGNMGVTTIVVGLLVRRRLRTSPADRGRPPSLKWPVHRRRPERL